ncbi:hypothetical protein A374_15858 [Fictibacillus macauensis ZFHKF-1]|uniref:SbsC C-terminal domain-containing protein n=1 Tax=Fictibacillus macauensis ZFHKF-1 TaxID=1196324 RepID=I8IXR2_9BACL|nr:hypothetical protein [Fictibacillus macauensis]EIT84276.1 hypothetical protein A374_15858 [Fictibacillus macauensis ZFHKF-1]
MKKAIALSVALTTSLTLLPTAHAASPHVQAVVTSQGKELTNQIKASENYLKQYKKDETANAYTKFRTKRFVSVIESAKAILVKDPSNKKSTFGNVLAELQTRTLHFMSEMDASHTLTAKIKEMKAAIAKKKFSSKQTKQINALIKKGESMLASADTIYFDLNDLTAKLNEFTTPRKELITAATKKASLKKQTLTSITTHYTYMSVDYGTSFKGLALPTTVDLVLDNKKEVPATVVWNKKDYNAKELGFQIITGEVTLPASLKDKVTIPKVFKLKNGKLRAVFQVQVRVG